MIRVLPRDAFNDGNLLKNIGQLALLIEEGLIPWLRLDYDGEPFDIQQDESDGSTFIANIEITKDGEHVHFSRPINSREPWSLYAVWGDDAFKVFDDNGRFILREKDFDYK